MNLSEKHKKMLTEESGIPEEVIGARGYRTVDKKAELETRGFSKIQRNVPGLLIPVYSPCGEIATYQYRPDEPRIKTASPSSTRPLPVPAWCSTCTPSRARCSATPPCRS